jgi:hypothetical protein
MIQISKVENKLIGATIVAAILGLIIVAIFTDPLVIREASKEFITAEDTGIREVKEISEFAISWTWLFLFTACAYIVFSFRFLDPVGVDENAALIFFGRAIGNVKSGPVFAPLGLFNLTKVTSEIIEKEFPDEPQNIFRGEMKDTTVDMNGKKPPIRVQFRNSITQAEAKEILGEAITAVRNYDADTEPDRVVKFVANAPEDGFARRLTAEPYVVVQFVIEDPSLFLRNIVSIENAKKQIEDLMFSVIQQYYPQMSIGQALQNVEWMNILLFNAVEKLIGVRGDLKPWGVSLQGAYVKYIYTSHQINTSVMKAAQALYDKQATITTAEGERERLVLEGRGIASAAGDLELKTLQGQTKGLTQQAEKLGITGEEALSRYVAVGLAKSTNTKVFGAEGFNQLAVLGSELIKKNKSEDTTTEE